MKTIGTPAPEDIIYLKGVINYTEFHLKGGQKLVTSHTLKKYEEQLSHFVRVSRSHLLNPQFIKTVRSYGPQKEVELLNGRRVTVSRRRAVLLKEKYPIARTY
ncbi:MAG: LytTR family transcriptional regulator [Cytophagales bacterium]|nr:LytTR family transcriptional regulator [Cytophagales bacterium]